MLKQTVEVIVDVVENKVDEEISKVVTQIVTDQLQSKSSSENQENFQEDSDRELTNKSSDENPQASTNEEETVIHISRFTKVSQKGFFEVIVKRRTTIYRPRECDRLKVTRMKRKAGKKFLYQQNLR